MRISIFKKIFLSQLALIILASGVVSLAGYFFMVRLYNQSQNDTLRIVSSAMAAKIATAVAQQQTTLKEIAEAREVALYAQKDQEPLLSDHLARYRERFPVLSYVDQEGNQALRLVNGQPAEEPLDNLGGLELFRASLAAPNQAILGQIAPDPARQTLLLRFAYTRVDAFDGRFLGQIQGQTPLAHILAPSGSGIAPFKGYCRVVASDGTILGDPQAKNILQPLAINHPHLGQLFAKADTGLNGPIHHATVNGEDCYFAAALIPGTPWLVMSVLRAPQYTAAPALFRNFSLFLFLALLLLAGISAFFLSRSLTSPIQKLARATLAMAQGDGEPRVAAGNDELGNLAAAFNAMAKKMGIAVKREEQLLAAEASVRLSAELADRHKGEFLAKVSHELRTPLNLILELSKLLGENEGSGKPRPEITAIREAGQNLLQLIDHILDFSRLESGSMRLAPAPFDLYALLGSVKKKYEPIARAKGLALFCEETPLVPTTVVGDEGRIFQILENLLDNAIKFTEHGDVSLRVRPLGLKAMHDRHIIHLRFEVADTGRGIPLEQQAAMFESFKQFEPHAFRKTGGLGIGLSICHQLVALMQGKIGMKSAPGKGSTFNVDLDLPVAKEGAGAEACGTLAPEKAKGTTDQDSAEKVMDILVAEDNPVNQKLLRLMLEMQGHKVRMTADGQEAVAVYQSEEVDLVLMDVQMPGMNGFEATAAIRELEGKTGRHVPIIAVTAHAMPGYREECLAAGMDNYLAKPFRMQELFAIIDATLAQLNNPG